MDPTLGVNVPIWMWAAFVGFVLAMLALDLGIFHRQTHVISMREAFTWTCVWVGLAALFALFLYVHFHSKDLAMEFITGYGLEESLSVDNLFVIIAIFSYLK